MLNHIALRTPALTLLCVTTAFALAGCKPRDMGVPTAEKAAESVDSSWVTATRSCWPELEHGFTLVSIQHNLADPLRFRSTFPVYAAQNEGSLRALVSKPLMSAPPPDITVLQNSRTPVLTRGQAAAGASPRAAIVQSTNGIAPPDALCAVHAGTPVGFK